MESIFKALSRDYNSVKDIQDIKLKDKQDLLRELVEYVNSMEWLSRVKTKEKISFFIKSGYDYNALCNELGISYVSAKNAVKWASKQLKAKIGKDTVGISARSLGNFDIVKILTSFGGGGDTYNGAAQIEKSTISKVEQELKKILKEDGE